jgi:hypothetical protein
MGSEDIVVHKSGSNQSSQSNDINHKWETVWNLVVPGEVLADSDPWRIDRGSIMSSRRLTHAHPMFAPPPAN